MEAEHPGNSQKDHYQPTQIESSTRFATRCHPDANAICEELDAFFAQHWPWSDQKAHEDLIKADLNRWTCWVYPLARSDRIFDIAKLITALFLLDDVAEETSFEDGKALYKRIISIAQGKVQPDHNKPIEWITYDVWAKMRSVDEALTESLFQNVLLCVRAQVDEARNRCTGMRALLDQRYKESGAGLVVAAMAYTMDLHLTPAELASISQIEDSYSKLAIIVNNIKSYEKEIRSFERNQAEGGKTLNMVQMQAGETGCSIAAAKRVLWLLCREWELEHIEMVAKREASPDGCSDTLKAYLKGLEYIMGGNELWSRYTQRYHRSR